MRVKLYGQDSLIHHFLFFGILSLSGFPYFTTKEASYIIYFILVLCAVFLERKKIDVNKNYLCFLLIPLIIITLQAFVFSFFNLTTILGFLVRTLSAVLVVQVLRDKFFDYFIVQLKILTLLSFIIYIPVSVIPDSIDLLGDVLPDFFSYSFERRGEEVNRLSLLLVNLNMDSPPWFPLRRNCGPFWEPGAFGGFLIIALIVSSIKNKSLFNSSNIIYFIGILTTFSTTVYVSLFALIIGYLVYVKKTKLKILIAPVLIIGIFVAYTQLGFMQEKIIDEFAGIDRAIEEKGGDMRMASAVLDFIEFSEHPIVGRGLWPETRIDKRFEFVVRNNGLTNFLTIWGLPYFVFFFVLLYRTFYKYANTNVFNKRIALVTIGVFFLLLVGENYFNFMFFWAMPMLAVYFTDEHTNEMRNYDLIGKD